MKLLLSILIIGLKAITMLTMFGLTIYYIAKHYQEPEKGYSKKAWKTILFGFLALIILTIIKFIVAFFVNP